MPLFHLLNLVPLYGHGFYKISRTIMRKNVVKNVSNDSPIVTVCDHIETL